LLVVPKEQRPTDFQKGGAAPPAGNCKEARETKCRMNR
jgi:hypothetical protein